MAKVHKVNFTPATGAEAVFELKNVLTGSGWSVVSSSNGTTFSAGDNITSSTSLAGSNRWFIVQEPTGVGGRQWCFQRTSDNATWRVKISPLNGFGGGTPSTTRVPSATDEGVILGAGTDASPTGAQLLPTDNTYKFHAISESTAVGPSGNQAYGFWAFANITGGVNVVDIETIIMQEPLATGSYPSLVGTRTSTTSGDADPALYACGYDNAGRKFILGPNIGFSPSTSTQHLAGTTGESDNTIKYFFDYQSAAGAFTNGDEVDGVTQIFRFLGTSPVSSPAQDILVPLRFGRYGTSIPANGSNFGRSTSVGFKGTTHFIRKSSVDRGVSNTINLSTNAYIQLNQLLIPWPENIVPSF